MGRGEKLVRAIGQSELTDERGESREDCVRGRNSLETRGTSRNGRRDDPDGIAFYVCLTFTRRN